MLSQAVFSKNIGFIACGKSVDVIVSFLYLLLRTLSR